MLNKTIKTTTEIKPVILSTRDVTGGAGKSSYRLHCALKQAGVNSLYMVNQKTVDDYSVDGPKTVWSKARSMAAPYLDNLFLYKYNKRNKDIFTTGWISSNINKRLSYYNFNIIHLHWISLGFISIEFLAKLKVPIVWTLHDSWAFTGGCHVPYNCVRYRDTCGYCPHLRSNAKFDLSALNILRKKRIFNHLQLTVVTPSKWLSECANSSGLFKDKNINVIPNGINVDLFKPVEKKLARNILSLPLNKILLLFGALDIANDRNKGAHIFYQAIKYLTEIKPTFDCEIVIFGASEPLVSENHPFRTHYMGRLYDEYSMSLLYSASNLFISSSMQENFPNTILESLSCGTPCVANDVGGVSDLITHKKNGYLANSLEVHDIAHGIIWLTEDEDRYNASCSFARRKVVSEFNVLKIGQKYIKLYEDILLQKE